MITTNDISAVTDGDVYDNDGSKIGSVGQIYLDNESGNPEWVTVKTGMFGGSASFVPLSEAEVDGGNLRVPYDKSKVKDAPNIDDDAELSPEEEDRLYEYYGISSTGGTRTGTDTDRTDTDLTDTDRTGMGQNVAAGTGRTDGDVTDRDRTVSDRDRDSGMDIGADSGADGGADTRRGDREVTDTEGHDTSGPNTDNAMTRSEEQLRVGTRSQETGRARLRKYVVTEEQTQTVPVSHEEVTIDREPITDANVGDATSGRDLSEEEHEVTLHAERPVVEKETVPVERIKMGTETVQGEETVTETVGKEQVEIDDDSGTRRN